RDIQVLKGEVFFDVIHDRKRPLRVCAAGHLFTDLGTQFNAFVSPSSTTLTVKYGEVEVGGHCEMGKMGELSITKAAPGRNKIRSYNESLPLTSGEQATLDGHAAGVSLVKRKLTRSQMDNLLAWQDGLLIFEKAPLQEVLDQINRYFPQRVEIADPSL